MPDAGGADFNHIKAHGGCGMGIKILAGGKAQMLLLLAVDSPCSLSHSAPGTGFYLNHHQGIALPGDDIDLPHLALVISSVSMFIISLFSL